MHTIMSIHPSRCAFSALKLGRGGAHRHLFDEPGPNCSTFIQRSRNCHINVTIWTFMQFWCIKVGPTGNPVLHEFSCPLSLARSDMSFINYYSRTPSYLIQRRIIGSHQHAQNSANAVEALCQNALQLKNECKSLTSVAIMHKMNRTTLYQLSKPGT